MSLLIINIFFQSMMSNPELMQQMIMSNPQMQQLVEVNTINDFEMWFIYYQYS